MKPWHYSKPWCHWSGNSTYFREISTSISTTGVLLMVGWRNVRLQKDPSILHGKNISWQWHFSQLKEARILVHRLEVVVAQIPMGTGCQIIMSNTEGDDKYISPGSQELSRLMLGNILAQEQSLLHLCSLATSLQESLMLINLSTSITFAG